MLASVAVLDLKVPKESDQFDKETRMMLIELTYLITRRVLRSIDVTVGHVSGFGDNVSNNTGTLRRIGVRAFGGCQLVFLERKRTMSLKGGDWSTYHRRAYSGQSDRLCIEVPL